MGGDVGMQICILGICGTFMANIALLAQQLGHQVFGVDEHIYPPMSDVLQDAGIEVMPPCDPPAVPEGTDLVLVGNSVRGDGPWAEWVRQSDIPYESAPEWLKSVLLKDRYVLAVAGTHGKTTTTAMLTWILHTVGLQPGYLIGGVPVGLSRSADLGKDPYFVIEADEYDTAFFDKQSKFMHYAANLFIVNNIEFDHADIFADVAEVERTFAAGVSLLPEDGVLLVGMDSPRAAKLAEQSAHKGVQGYGIDNGSWRAKALSDSGSEFQILCEEKVLGEVSWQLCGAHNRLNGLAAVAAAVAVGVAADKAIDALSRFPGVKRRLENLGEYGGVTLYDDFAHHPTAIYETLRGLRAKVGPKQRIVAVLQFASNTMRGGHHDPLVLADALLPADCIFLHDSGGVSWSLDTLSVLLKQPVQISVGDSALAEQLLLELRADDHLIFMGNKDLSSLQKIVRQQLGA